MSNLSQSTALNMFDIAGETIETCEKNADNCAQQLAELESKPNSDLLNAVKGIIKTMLILDYINLDICAAIRQYLSTDCSAKYDKRQAMTKINIVMSEGYKKMYGFVEKERNSSYWRHQIKLAVKYVGGLDKEYTDIENELIAFSNNDMLNREMRDLAVHYDFDPMKVYQMLSKLDAVDITRRCFVFFRLINKITRFVWKLSETMLSRVI